MKKRNNFFIITGFLVLIFTFSLMVNGCRKNIVQTEPLPTPPTETPTVETPTSEMPEGLYPLAQRQTAPEFNLPKLDGSGDLSLSSLKGKIVLIDFTTTWCIWCTRQQPQVEDLFKKYESKGFTVIAIDCNEPKDTVLSKYPGGTNMYPVVLDLNGEVSRNQYGVQGFPFYLLIDKTGKVAYVQSGYKEDMFVSVSKMIDYLMDKEP